MENTIAIKSVMIIPNVTKPDTLEYTNKLVDFFEEIKYHSALL